MVPHFVARIIVETTLPTKRRKCMQVAYVQWQMQLLDGNDQTTVR